jgi:hypothetical protein
MRDMLNEHLRLTTDEAGARISGNYTADIDAFDAIHDQAMEMADGLSSGIITQFPEKFEELEEEMEHDNEEEVE